MAMPPGRDGRPIGQLRYPIRVSPRFQVPDPLTTSILESTEFGVESWADIQPIGSLTFYAATQVDVNVTHRIVMRWMSGVDTNFVAIRCIARPDLTTPIEIFRLLRLMEEDGRFRYMIFEAVLERYIP